MQNNFAAAVQQLAQCSSEDEMWEQVEDIARARKLANEMTGRVSDDMCEELIEAAVKL